MRVPCTYRKRKKGVCVSSFCVKLLARDGAAQEYSQQQQRRKQEQHEEYRRIWV